MVLVVSQCSRSGAGLLPNCARAARFNARGIKQGEFRRYSRAGSTTRPPLHGFITEAITIVIHT
jgi:hypothetical protein